MNLVKKDHVVVVSNELLTQPMSFTLAERRLLAMALSSIKPSYNNYPDKVAQERFTVEQLKEMYWQQIVGDVVTSSSSFQITVANYASLFSLTSSNARAELQDAVLRLYDRSIKVDTKKHLGFFRWVSSAVFDKETGSASIRFTEEVLPYIHGLQRHFTQIRLKKVVELQSTYSWRLYELYRMKQTSNSRVSPSFSLEELYTLLDVPESRREFRKFNERILKKAVAELQDKNVVSIKVVPEKLGNKVIGVRFERGLKEIRNE
jgi:plasmid replication initiation protein